MRALLRITAGLAALVALSCAGPVGPGDTSVTGACTSDLACPYGEECGIAGCEALSPSLYSHIQTASAIFFREYLPGELEWRAAHSDLLINDISGYVDEIRAINPHARLFEYMYTRYHNYNEFGGLADAWAADNGYDPEDFYLHYREDVAVPTWEGVVLVEGQPPGVVPGWNPDWSPGDPPASATSRAQSRVPGFAGAADGTTVWKMANIEHPGYRRFLQYWAGHVMDGSLENQPVSGPPLDGMVCDNAIYYPRFGEGVLDRTDEYYGIPLTPQHPYAMGFATLFPEMTGGLAARFARGVDVMPNFGHVLYTTHSDPAPQYVVANVPWIWCEVWLQYTGGTITSGSARTITWDADYEKAIAAVVRQTRGPGRRVLGARDISSGEAGTDRGRMLTLALYYLIHNRNTWYMYESVQHHGSDTDMSQWAWNPAVEFDIGRPDQVPSGNVDFDGNYPSDEHYVFATGADPYRGDLTYRVLARRFTNALVLAKMLPAGSVVGDASITTHSLDGSYAILRPDGTLGDVVTEVSIRNNEGLILIPVN